MNAWTRIALLIGCIAAPLSFSAVDAHPPQIKRIGEALTAFKKLAHAPVAVGECDIKEGKYTTHVVLYIRAETELFEIENSGKNFHYLRTSGRPIVFVYEHSGVFEEIPLDQMNMILRSAGAAEFVKSVDSPPLPSDCVARAFDKGQSISIRP